MTYFNNDSNGCIYTWIVRLGVLFKRRHRTLPYQNKSFVVIERVFIREEYIHYAELFRAKEFITNLYNGEDLRDP